MLRDPCNAGIYACRAIRCFPKGVSCPLENACGSHSMWHRSCRRKSYRDKVSSVKPGYPGRNQCQGGMLSHYGYLEVDYGKRWVYHDSTEHLVVYVPVQIFHQLPVGESGVCLQDHKGDLCGRAEYVPTTQVPVRQACGFYHTIKRKQRMKPAKLTLMKTLAIVFQNIKFWKTQSRVNS